MRPLFPSSRIFLGQHPLTPDSSAAGSSVGTSTATAVGSSTAASPGSAAGAGTAAAVGSSQATSPGSSTGISTVTATGSSQAASVGAAIGSATVTGISPGGAIGASSAVATVTGIGSSQAASSGSVAGAGAATGTGSSQAASPGSSSGVGTAAAVGSSTVAAHGTAAGISTAAGIGSSQAASVGLGVVFFGTGVTTPILADSPIAYWLFNEAIGSIAFDSSGNALDASYQNSPTLGVAGPISGGGTAVTFDGISQGATRADDPLLRTADTFSIEFWINPASLTGTPDILEKGANAYEFLLNAGHTRIAKTASTNVLTATNVITPAGAWTHIIITKSGATRHIYANAVDVPAAGTNVTFAASSNNLFIGSFNGTGGFFSGSLYGLAIFSTALTLQQALTHFNAKPMGAAAISNSTVASTGTASGTASAAGAGSSTVVSLGSSAGASTAAGIGIAGLPGDGGSTGIATVSATGAAETQGAGSAAGVGVATALVSTINVTAAGNSFGIATAAGILLFGRSASDRTVQVSAGINVVIVPSEARSVVIPSEARSVIVPAD